MEQRGFQLQIDKNNVMKTNDDRFNFFIPITTIKKSKDKNGKEEMIVEGIASTPERDLEGEILNPKGYELDYFLKSGWLKWEHDKDPKNYIGQPTHANITKENELFIRGKLFPESKTAREVYELAEVLEKADTDRQIGWSIEGKAKKRDPMNPKKVERAMITNVVLTTNPIGMNTWAQIVKGQYDEAFIKPEYDISTTCDGDSCLLDVDYDGFKYTLTPEFDIIKKSLTKGCDKKTAIDLDEDDPDTLKKDNIEVQSDVKRSGVQQMRSKTGWSAQTKTTSASSETDAKQQIERHNLKKTMMAGGITGRETDTSSPAHKGGSDADMSGAALKEEDVEGCAKNQTYDIKKKKCREKITKALFIIAFAHNNGLINLERLRNK
jgi:hypothetical protein